MLTEKDIEEYREIYKKVFKKEISYSEALEQGTRLLNFFKIICKSEKSQSYNGKYR